MRLTALSRARWLLLAAAGLLTAPLAADEKKTDRTANDKIKEVAGTAEFLRSVPKHFATFQAFDPARNMVTLLLEGEKLAKVWPVAPDAEVKVFGWWGRLNQVTPGDRVWVWFQTDRQKQAAAVAMLADEPSEEDIHGPGVEIVAANANGITVKTAGGQKRTLKTEHDTGLRKPGAHVYIQSGGGRARLVLDPAAFESRRNGQKAHLRKLWAAKGLPGMVTFLHRFSGEMEVMLDHEAMRWGRSLKLGDKVTLEASPPINAVVKEVRPWRERTQLRLVVNSFDQTELSPGQRIRLKMPPPSAAVDAAALPPDMDRPRSKAERVEWFLASIYCACGVKGDVCTGHFYTLASCNVNGCGMPRAMRQALGEKIDKGLTDRQILEGLLKDYGPDLLRPHLLP